MACLHLALACWSLSLTVSSFTAAFTIAKSISINLKTLNSSVTILSSTFPSSLRTSASSLALSATISPAFASSSVLPNSLPIKPSNFSKKSAITYPIGFSTLISLVLFHPISKFGGSALESSDCLLLSLRISDLLLFSIGKVSGLLSVLEEGSGVGKSGWGVESKAQDLMPNCFLGWVWMRDCDDWCRRLKWVLWRQVGYERNWNWRIVEAMTVSGSKVNWR